MVMSCSHIKITHLMLNCDKHEVASRSDQSFRKTKRRVLVDFLRTVIKPNSYTLVL